MSYGRREHREAEQRLAIEADAWYTAKQRAEAEAAARAGGEYERRMVESAERAAAILRQSIGQIVIPDERHYRSVDNLK